MKDLSIIVITHRRNDLLKKCLESILKNDLRDSYEVIVVINGPDRDTEKFLGSFRTNIPTLQFFSIPRTSKGSARNFALKQSQGEIVYFLDDDVEIAKDNLQKLIEKFKNYNDIGVIGGPNLTPEDSSFFQRCSGYLLGSIFGSVTMRFRYTVLPEERIADDKYLILCNLAFRREIFSKEKLDFNGDIACNEENLLLHKLKKKGYKILYSPDIIVYHERRKNLWLLMEQFFRYGRGRGQMTRLIPSSLPFFTILPSAFLVYVISLLFFHKSVYIIPLSLYLFLDIIFSLWPSIENKETKAIPLLFVLFPITHISYGAGFLAGLIK